MNKELFEKLMPGISHDRTKLIQTAVETTDVIGSVLRTHLVCEQIINAWVCAKLNSEKIFENTQINFYSQMKIANNLEYPESLYKIIDAIRRIRNSLAHDPTQSTIPQNHMESAITLTQNYLRVKDSSTTFNYGFVFYDGYGNKETISLSDPLLPDQKKLVAVVGILILATIQAANKIFKP